MAAASLSSITWLHSPCRPVDDLLLSQRNIGKIDALRILFNAAPGEIIAYNDDDIFFYPGWLEAHLEILDSFPKAGMVSGAAGAQCCQACQPEPGAPGCRDKTSERTRRTGLLRSSQ